MKILINENKTITASVLTNYVIAADLSAEVMAAPTQTMLAAVQGGNSDIVIRYDDEIDNLALCDFFRSVSAHDKEIYRILIVGSKNLQKISDELSELADEILIYPFATHELMIRLRRIFGKVVQSEKHAADEGNAAQGTIQQPAECPLVTTELEPEPAKMPVNIEPNETTLPTVLAEPEQPKILPPTDTTSVEVPAEVQGDDKSPEIGQLAELDEIIQPPFSPPNITVPAAVTESLSWEDGAERAVPALNITAADLEQREAAVPADNSTQPQTAEEDTGVNRVDQEPQLAETGNGKNNTLKKTAGVIGKVMTVVVILLIAVLAILILTSKINNGTPTVFGYQFYNVLTGSMKGYRQDSFDKGSLILVKPIKPEDIKTGDIITFDRQTSDSKLTTHRVKIVNMDVDGNLSFTTQGDANGTPDSIPVPANIIKGKVILSIAHAGNIVGFAQTNTGMIFTVFIPAGAIVIYEIYIFYQEHMERKQLKKEASAAKKEKK